MMYDGEDTQMNPPAQPTDAPQEQAMPQEAEQAAPQADQASETPAQA